MAPVLFELIGGSQGGSSNTMLGKVANTHLVPLLGIDVAETGPQEWFRPGADLRNGFVQC